MTQPHQTARQTAEDALQRISPTVRACDYCGKPFTPRRGWSRFCTSPCRSAKWTAEHPRLPLVDVTTPETSAETFTQRVADYFKARPNKWIDAKELMRVGGSCAWRTRVSNCRTRHGLDIENRQRRELRANGRPFKISEYRLVVEEIR